MFNCSCCGTDIASPYFYNGGVYGWSCIKKVNPNAKRNKAKSKTVEVNLIKFDFDENSTRGKALVEIDGAKSVVTAYRNYEDGFFSELSGVGNFKLFNGKWWAII